MIAAVSGALRDAMANVHGAFAASERSTETRAAAREAIADLVGGTPDGVILGPNMTTMTFQLADALAADWKPGDEVIVTSLDHDANIRPWVLAAQRAGATVRWAEFDVATGELAPEAFDALLSERTRLVAVTAASNAIGTRPDVAAITRSRARRRRADLRRRGARHAPRPDRRRGARRRLLRLLDLQVLRAPHRRGDR